MDETRKKSEVLEFELVYLDGRKVRLDELSDKAMIINAWATWCPFCVEELQAFAEVKKDFSDQIEIVAINRAESAKNCGGVY